MAFSDSCIRKVIRYALNKENHAFFILYLVSLYSVPCCTMLCRDDIYTIRNSTFPLNEDVYVRIYPPCILIPPAHPALAYPTYAHHGRCHRTLQILVLNYLALISASLRSTTAIRQAPS